MIPMAPVAEQDEQRERRRRRWWPAAIIVGILIAAAATLLLSFDISALPAPSGLETALATAGKHWFVGRAAGDAPPAPPDTAANRAAGQSLFGMACANCHGQDGRTAAPIGQAMYPRATDLGASATQDFSNQELFWIIKNGIRLTGMPGFAHINSDQEIWQLTYFVRSLGRAPGKAAGIAPKAAARR